jgi:hypothetical protein
VILVEAIFGVIEDLIERVKANDPDAKHELKNNFPSLVSNLESMTGNAEAAKLLGELKSLKLD